MKNGFLEKMVGKQAETARTDAKIDLIGILKITYINITYIICIYKHKIDSYVFLGFV